MGKETATEKGKEMRKRKLKFICPHCKKEAQIVDVMQDAEVYMPIDYVDTEGFLHYDRQEPMIVSRKGHFACDECGGRIPIRTSGFANRYDALVHYLERRFYNSEKPCK